MKITEADPIPANNELIDKLVSIVSAIRSFASFDGENLLQLSRMPSIQEKKNFCLRHSPVIDCKCECEPGNATPNANMPYNWVYSYPTAVQNTPYYCQSRMPSS